MKNKLLLIAVLAALCFPAFSQNSDSTNYKNHFGIIGGQGGPFGIIYKRQVKPDAAWRFTQSGNYGTRNHPGGIINDSTGFYNFRHFEFYLQTLVGYEWQNQISKRWTVYYGADAGFGYGTNSYNYNFDNFRSDLYSGRFQDNKQNYKSYILQPMAGVKFDISSKFYVALESNATLNYTRTTTKGYETIFEPGQPGFETRQLGSKKSNNFNMGFSAISNIQLVYKF